MVHQECCPVCSKTAKERRTHMGQSVYTCSVCGLQWLDQDSIVIRAENQYTESLDAITPLRKRNNAKIIEQIHRFTSTQKLDVKSGLEVGPAIGLFMQQAIAAGYQMTGIEPMETSFQQALAKGLHVIKGYFPSNALNHEKFDFIAFNDVFEHIPDCMACIEACDQHLKQNGILIINLPDSRGILYRCARIMDFLGDGEALKRLWQLQTESPHLYYFNNKALTGLLHKAGFTLLCPPIRMKSFLSTNIKERISLLPMTPWKAWIIGIGLKLAYPLIQLLPADTRCYLFRKHT